MASSTLCNLLLEFSPSKEVNAQLHLTSLHTERLFYPEVCVGVCACVFAQPILESGVIELLCSLTQSDSPALRVNGTWALMVAKPFAFHLLWSWRLFFLSSTVTFIMIVFRTWHFRLIRRWRGRLFSVWVQNSYSACCQILTQTC